MSEVKKDPEVFFGRPFVGDEIDVKGLLSAFKSGSDRSNLLELYEGLGYDVSKEDIETALEYAENNPEEIQAIREDDQRFNERYDSDFMSEDEFEEAYREFVSRNDTEYDFLIE